jgi:hypothetical protein
MKGRLLLLAATIAALILYYLSPSHVEVGFEDEVWADCRVDDHNVCVPTQRPKYQSNI